jgi:hypothetical protein
MPPITRLGRETLGPHHDDIHRIANIAHGVQDLDSSLVGIRRGRFDHQQVYVAVLRHLPGSGGSKQNDPIRTRHREDAAHNLA